MKGIAISNDRLVEGRAWPTGDKLEVVSHSLQRPSAWLESSPTVLLLPKKLPPRPMLTFPASCPAKSSSGFVDDGLTNTS